ncbi:MAG: hypothetical protein E6R02_04495 [Gammaproteobacteria bacterium]|nr:MAG: hypothetical protein E6R02_04495 [Gammaproteobacteria bacterium]
MSMSNATENATLKMHLQGTDPSYRAGATQYLALVTDAAGAVDEASPIANECTYTGYARVALTKATAWTDNGSTFKDQGRREHSVPAVPNRRHHIGRHRAGGL